MAQRKKTSLSDAEIEKAVDLERRLIEAFREKDVDAAMRLFWNHPDAHLVMDGMVLKGPDEIRKWFESAFAENESIKITVNDVHHVASGDGVIGVGTATYEFTPVSGPRRLMVERWSDLRRKIDGSWVMVLDHATSIEHKELED